MEAEGASSEQVKDFEKILSAINSPALQRWGGKSVGRALQWESLLSDAQRGRFSEGSPVLSSIVHSRFITDHPRFDKFFKSVLTAAPEGAIQQQSQQSTRKRKRVDKVELVYDRVQRHAQAATLTDVAAVLEEALPFQIAQALSEACAQRIACALTSEMRTAVEPGNESMRELPRTAQIHLDSLSAKAKADGHCMEVLLLVVVWLHDKLEKSGASAPEKEGHTDESRLLLQVLCERLADIGALDPDRLLNQHPWLMARVCKGCFPLAEIYVESVLRRMRRKLRSLLAGSVLRDMESLHAECAGSQRKPKPESAWWQLSEQRVACLLLQGAQLREYTLEKAESVLQMLR